MNYSLNTMADNTALHLLKSNNSAEDILQSAEVELRQLRLGELQADAAAAPVVGRLGFAATTKGLEAGKEAAQVRLANTWQARQTGQTRLASTLYPK